MDNIDERCSCGVEAHNSKLNNMLIRLQNTKIDDARLDAVIAKFLKSVATK